MSCYKPNLGFLSSNEKLKIHNPLRILPWTEENKKIYFDMVNVDTNTGEVFGDDVDIRLREGSYKINWKSKYFDSWTTSDGWSHKYVLCKCNQCIGCRLDASREWASRCELEYKAYEELYGRDAAHWSCWFVTLTYDDDHLPIGTALEPTAVIQDISDFMKNLRVYAERDGKVLDGFSENVVIDPEYLPTGLRFYATSDYGAKYKRPHYHMILFGLKQSLFDKKTGKGDLEYFFTNEMGDPLYHSLYLRKIWKKGFVDVGFFDWRTAAYTARYVVSKHKGLDSVYYENHGIEAEVSRQSNRPGIGALYYYLHENDIFKHDRLQLSQGRQCPIPRYFKKLYLKGTTPVTTDMWTGEYDLIDDYQVDPRIEFMWEYSKRKAHNADASLYNELHETDLDLRGYFRAAETKKKQEAKKLIRMLD